MELAHLEVLKHHTVSGILDTEDRAGAAFQSVVLQLGRLTELRVKHVDFISCLFEFKETDLGRWMKLRYFCPTFTLSLDLQMCSVKMLWPAG